MAGKSGIAGLVLGIGAIASAAAAVWWWSTGATNRFYTDDAGIRTDADEAPLRDVLWQPPESLLGEANTDAEEYEPRLSRDGNRLYFSRASEDGDSDLWIADRSGDEWVAARPLRSANSIDNELGARESEDGQWLYFASDRPGGSGGFDLWRSPRVGRGWGEAEPLRAGINTSANELAPMPWGDGVLFSSDREVAVSDDDELPDAGGYELYEAGVASRPVSRLDGLASAGDEMGPALSPRGDFLYFASDRADGLGGMDLYRVRRAAGETGVEYGVVEPLLDLNTAANEADPSISLEGFAIHFASDGVASSSDLYRSVTREVYLSSLSRFADMGWLADLLGLLPWILAVLAAVLLLALLRRAAAATSWERGIATVGLLARAILASLLVHAALVVLLSIWAVVPDEGEDGTESGTRVSLASGAAGAAARSQIRSAMTASAASAARTASSAAAPTPMNVESRSVEMAAASNSARAVESMMMPASSSAEAAASSASSLDAQSTPVEAMQMASETSATVPEVAAAERGTESSSSEAATRALAERVASSGRVAPDASDPNAGTRAAELAAAGGSIRAPEAQAGIETGTRDAAEPSAGGSPLVTSTDVAALGGAVSADAAAVPEATAASGSGTEAALAEATAPSVTGSAGTGPELAQAGSSSVELTGVAGGEAIAEGSSGIETSAAEAASAGGEPAVLQPTQIAGLGDLDGVGDLAMPEAATADGGGAETAIAAADGLSAEQVGDGPEVGGGASSTVALDAAGADASVGGGLAIEAELADAAASGRLDVATPTFDASALGLDADFAAALPGVGEDDGSAGGEVEIEGVSSLASSDGNAVLDGPDASETLVDLAAAGDAGAVNDALAFETGSGDAAPTLDLGLGLPGLDVAASPLAALEADVAMPEYVEPIDARLRLSGLVRDEDTGEPIEGATIKIDLQGTDLVVATDAAGEFALTADDIPSTVALTASHPGYVPGAESLDERDLEDGAYVEMLLSALDPYDIALESTPEVHHLGDDSFSGRVNSQFQRETEGVSIGLPFVLGDEQAGPEILSAELSVLMKGTQSENRVELNGRVIGESRPSPSDGSFREQRFRVPVDLLLEGGNLLRFRSARASRSDRDDFEFVNPRLILTPRIEGNGSAEVANAEEWVRGIVVDEDTREPIAGATVRLPLRGTQGLWMRTEADGRFAFGVERLPDFGAITAEAEDYEPGAGSFERRDALRERPTAILLKRRDPNVIALEDEPEVHHLGNDAFTGRVNSQFQRESEGETISFDFELGRDQVAPRIGLARLELVAKGIQGPHRIYVNGRRLRAGFQNSPSSGAYATQQIPIPAELLLIGENTIRITTTPAPDNDVDDWEFVRPRVILLPARNYGIY
ncbi:MAG: carboxypeptidase regulatory-like domain-containing protein [Planctomycetota bacterium]